MPLITVPMLVGMFVMMQMVSGDPTYTASAQLTITRAPQQLEIEDFRFNEYYLFRSSEFMLDDLVEIVRGNVFAADIQERIRDEFGTDIPAGEIQSAIASNRRHRILTIDVTNADADRAVMIAQAATEQLSQEAPKYFGFDAPERGALVEPVQVADHAGQTAGQDQIFWALQLLVAVFAGVLLAFLFDHLDDRLHSAEMVEHSLGLDVIAEVPRGEVN
jgi:capsular polysaccharide biosynthesis protein